MLICICPTTNDCNCFGVGFAVFSPTLQKTCMHVFDWKFGIVPKGERSFLIKNICNFTWFLMVQNYVQTVGEAKADNKHPKSHQILAKVMPQITWLLGLSLIMVSFYLTVQLSFFTTRVILSYADSRGLKVVSLFNVNFLSTIPSGVILPDCVEIKSEKELSSQESQVAPMHCSISKLNRKYFKGICHVNSKYKLDATLHS